MSGIGVDTAAPWRAADNPDVPPSVGRAPGSGVAEALLVAVGGLALLIVGYNRSLLPSYYFNDDRTLRQYMAGDPHVSTGNSFSTAAFLFDAVGLRDASTAVGFITFALFLLGVLLARRATAVRTLTLGDTLIYGVALLMGAVYLGQLSKEPFVLLVVLGFLVLARHWAGEIVWGLVFVLPLALYLRPYWALVGLFYLAFRLWFRRERKVWHLVALPAAALLVLAVAVHVVLGKVSVVAFRTDVQHDLTTLYGAANSSVHDYLPVAGLGYGWADAVLSLFLLIVPIPLLLLGGVQYLATGLVISGLWYRFFGVARSYSGRFATMPPLALRCVFLSLSFVSIQAIFEPDYGSYLRHLTDLMPVFVLVIGTGRALARQVPVESVRALQQAVQPVPAAPVPQARVPAADVRPGRRPAPGPGRLSRPSPSAAAKS